MNIESRTDQEQERYVERTPLEKICIAAAKRLWDDGYMDASPGDRKEAWRVIHACFTEVGGDE